MKHMIRKMLIFINSIFMLVILVFIGFIYTLHYQETWEKQTYTLFTRVEHILKKNTDERENTIAEYKQICLNYADAVAYILDKNPEIIEDIDELKKIASLIQIDEIHIFDESGTIVDGTEPKYYGFSVNDGEQIGFFKQMLEDKSLRLCQDVTPNTAEKKEMQYAAVWGKSGTYFVQVGATPDRVLDVISKNQLSYIFSLFASDSDTTLYAIDTETGNILGATDPQMAGKNITDLGISLEKAGKEKNPFFCNVSGVKCYCVSKLSQSEDTPLILLGTCSTETLYHDLKRDIATIAVCLLGIIFITVCCIEYFLNKNIIQGINDINKQLTDVAKGETEQVVNVCHTPEFALLSSCINKMTKSILRESEKLSFVLDHANLSMGIFEYGADRDTVRVTNGVKNILKLEDGDAEALFSDSLKFQAYIESIQRHPVENTTATYQLKEDTDRYVRMEYFEKGKETVGLLIDVTGTILQRKQLEKERDLDILTGLYNRRAMETKLEALFSMPDKLGHSMLIMLDADGLKQINDKYEHKAGDNYLCEIARLLESIQAKNRIIARQGGDEFVLFYYGCDCDDALTGYLTELNKLREQAVFAVDSETILPVKYSFGYIFCYGREGSYSDLLREADLNMYKDKTKRRCLRRS